MQVYVLEGRYPSAPERTLIGVFSNPKAARRYVEERGIASPRLRQWTIDLAECGYMELLFNESCES
jgi:hypothetical protein